MNKSISSALVVLFVVAILCQGCLLGNV